MNTQVYAIRHKYTRLYLPDRQGKGYSNDEPTSKDKPRLFWKESSAKAALRAWLQGRWVKKVSGGYGSGPLDMEYDEETVIEPIPSRKAEDMEIVRFDLVEVMKWERNILVSSVA